MNEDKKISSSLRSMRNQGALTASVVIEFASEDARESFDSEGFEFVEDKSTFPASEGVLELEHLDDLANDERVEYVEENVRVSVPQDPSEPQ